MGIFILLLLLTIPATISGSGHEQINHSDPVIPILLALTIITLIALMGREVAQRLELPSVLGELTIGILIGNLGYWLGSDLIAVLRESTAVFNAITLTFENGTTLEAALQQTLDPPQVAQLLPILSSADGNRIIDLIQVIDIFSRIGLLFLLFVVGLESSIHELKASIKPGIRVAAIGVIAPFILGFGVMELFAPSAGWSSALMVSIALCATSIGITAHVFHELQMESTRTAHIVLSAAVIDDVLGLIMMAIGIDIIFRGSFDAMTVLYSISQAIMFLASIYLLVPTLIRFTIRHLHHFSLWEAELFVSFLLLTTLSWLADFVGLSAIVGAFAAGLILSNKEFTYWKQNCENEASCYLDEEIKNQIRPFEAILAPIFFVLMGTQVKLEAFLNQEILLLASALTVVAVAGKLVSGLGAPAHYARFAIGAGMVPRGEVALILASLGKTVGVLSSTLFTAVVMMTIITTLLGPPLLKWQLNKAPLK
ncbi:MAG: cation:proton antiporter [Thiotrichales bacterium]|jgi:Kef-type K+ transport system membrane component KefB|nr:cation:proton antiporter [Thiotrichales bacterium]MBT8006788.1 cation:proton antiporter [Gammaproteobacteria bacterium]